MVTLQLAEHADQKGKRALLARLEAAPQVQFCYELAGVIDFLLLLDCSDMAEFNHLVETRISLLNYQPEITRHFFTDYVATATLCMQILNLLPKLASRNPFYTVVVVMVSRVAVSCKLYVTMIIRK